MYEREVLGEPVEFGVSGQLYNSDLLMYDRKTESLWQQISGVAVVGEQTGERLEYYPSRMMTWGEWQERYPDSEVLSRLTGHIRDYDGKPYAAYFDREDLLFGVNALNTQLFAKEYVIGVELPDGGYAAYLDRDISELGAINDAVGDHLLLVAIDPNSGAVAPVFNRRVNGQALTFAIEDGTLVDQETGTIWDLSGLAVEGELAGHQLDTVRSLRLFWFAWVAFHPDTELRRPGE